MWRMRKNILGLFVGINQGKIVSCHGKQTENSLVNRRKKKKLPFCMENEGIIEGESETQSSRSDIKDRTDESSMEDDISIIEIHSAQQLMEIAKQINTGDRFYCEGNYKLLADLDLKKQKWVPIGINQRYSFRGTFDGNGHAIKNVHVRGNKKECIGFFGYVKQARICNLSIEGKIRGGNYTGAIAGINDDSTISYCFASVKLYGHYCAGGLVGKNQGDILHCYYAGNVCTEFVSP